MPFEVVAEFPTYAGQNRRQNKTEHSNYTRVQCATEQNVIVFCYVVLLWPPLVYCDSQCCSLLHVWKSTVTRRMLFCAMYAQNQPPQKIETMWLQRVVLVLYFCIRSSGNFVSFCFPGCEVTFCQHCGLISVLLYYGGAVVNVVLVGRHSEAL